MKQIPIPAFPIEDGAALCDFPDIFGIFVTAFEERYGEPPPMLIFEPHPTWDSGYIPSISDAPEELIIVALDSYTQNACFQALEHVEDREPKLEYAQDKLSVSLSGETLVREIFSQMSDIPITVFSVTSPKIGEDTISVFFLRTPFTVSEFRREFERHNK